MCRDTNQLSYFHIGIGNFITCHPFSLITWMFTLECQVNCIRPWTRLSSPGFHLRVRIISANFLMPGSSVKFFKSRTYRHCAIFSYTVPSISQKHMPSKTRGRKNGSVTAVQCGIDYSERGFHKFQSDYFSQSGEAN